jgi:hypothetical protein
MEPSHIAGNLPLIAQKTMIEVEIIHATAASDHALIATTATAAEIEAIDTAQTTGTECTNRRAVVLAPTTQA